jgi:hypothetical protein
MTANGAVTRVPRGAEAQEACIAKGLIAVPGYFTFGSSRSERSRARTKARNTALIRVW